MELSETAEQAVEMWTLVRAKLVARSQGDIDPQIQAQILSESMKLHMTNIINQAKGSSSSPQQQSDAKMASEKQLAYIKDLGGDPSTVRTSYEASQYIEELRKK